jgi:hypothetical protein
MSCCAFLCLDTCPHCTVYFSKTSTILHSMSLPNAWEGYISPSDVGRLLESTRAVLLASSSTDDVAHGIMMIDPGDERAYSPALYTHVGIHDLPTIRAAHDFVPIGEPTAPLLYYMVRGGVLAKEYEKSPPVTIQPADVYRSVLMITNPTFYLSGSLVVCAEGFYLFNVFKSKKKKVLTHLERGESGGNAQFAQSMTDYLLDQLRLPQQQRDKTPSQLARSLKKCAEGINVRYFAAKKLREKGFDIRKGGGGGGGNKGAWDDASSMASSHSNSSSFSSSVSSVSSYIDHDALLSVSEPFRAHPQPHPQPHQTTMTHASTLPPAEAYEMVVRHVAPSLDPSWSGFVAHMSRYLAYIGSAASASNPDPNVQYQRGLLFGTVAPLPPPPR